VVVNRSHGVNGAVALANVVALSASMIATPPELSANPQKPLNSKPSGGFTARRKRDSAGWPPRWYRRTPTCCGTATRTSFEMDGATLPHPLRRAVR
jgi:hypothetical protein